MYFRCVSGKGDTSARLSHRSSAASAPLNTTSHQRQGPRAAPRLLSFIGIASFLKKFRIFLPIAHYNLLFYLSTFIEFYLKFYIFIKNAHFYRGIQLFRIPTFDLTTSPLYASLPY